jgi:hypothetical protein
MSDILKLGMVGGKRKMDPECGQGVESDPAKGQWPLSNNTINSMTQQNLPGAVNNSLSLPNSVTKVSANYRIMVWLKTVHLLFFLLPSVSTFFYVPFSPFSLFSPSSLHQYDNFGDSEET